MFDCDLIIELFNQYDLFRLSIEITNLAGNLLSKTLLGDICKRAEYLLLHAFYEQNYILPEHKKNANFNNKSTTNNDDHFLEQQEENMQIPSKNTYARGLVLEPKVGLYNTYVILMDFNSLYPSIIQEFNICFTTQREEENVTEFGILPNLMRELIEMRKKIKITILNCRSVDDDDKRKLDIKQKSLKLTANSIYGYLCKGYVYSRFYARSLAELITLKGREVLTNTKRLVESLNQDVIYGDTDSLMINTNQTDYEYAKSLAYTLQSTINKNYRFIEIGVEKIFRKTLLITKKKYAAIYVVEDMRTKTIRLEKEIKGIDVIRRDYSLIGRKVGEKVLDEILSLCNTTEQIKNNIATYLNQIVEQINESNLKLEEYLINKRLNKNPEDYIDKKNLSHVLVAKEKKHFNARLIAMSATLGNIEQIAKFMKAKIEKYDFRPIELVEYVKINQTIYTYNGNAGFVEHRPLKKEAPTTDPDNLTELVDECMPNSPVLIFCPTKKQCESVVTLLCSHLPDTYREFKKEERQQILDALVNASFGTVCPILRLGALWYCLSSFWSYS